MSGVPRTLLGIDIGGTKVALAVGRANGERLGEASLPTEKGIGADGLIRRIADAAQALLARTGTTPAGIGVATPGVLQDGIVRLAPNIKGWDGLPLAERMREALGLAAPLLVATDAKAAARAEYAWGALAGSRCGVFLNLGTGLSAGIVVDGHILHGAHGAAGEIAYQLLRPGEPGHAAGRAPLEEHVSGRALGERASALAGRTLHAGDALAATEGPVAALVEQALEILGQYVVNLCCVIDCDRIVIGGGLAAAAGRIVPRLEAALAAGAPFPPPVLLARFAFEAPLMGALALADEAAAESG